jgi:hypothetical protein
MSNCPVSVGNYPDEIAVNFVKMSIPFFMSRHEFKAIDWDMLEITFDYDIDDNSMASATVDTIYINMYHHASMPELLKSLAHELAHVAQYHSGRLKKLPMSSKYIYDGKEYAASRTYAQYWNSPDEVDARKHEHLGRKAYSYILVAASAA